MEVERDGEVRRRKVGWKVEERKAEREEKKIREKGKGGSLIGRPATGTNGK